MSKSQKYLVFAGSTDDENPKLGLDDLIGEMPMQDAYAAIKKSLEENEYFDTGEIARIENGKLSEHLNYFRGVAYSGVGKHLRGGFRNDDGMVLFEDETTPYGLSHDEIEATFKSAIEAEGGVFSHTDFTGDRRMSAISYFNNNMVYTYLDFAALFGAPSSVRGAIAAAVIETFTNHRAWIAKGSPTYKATGAW